MKSLERGLYVTLVAHSTEIVGPPQKLAKFLIRSRIFEKVFIIFHPLAEYTKAVYTTMIYLDKARRVSKILHVPTRVSSNILTYLIQMIITPLLMIPKLRPYALCIGADFSNLLSIAAFKPLFRRKFMVIFYVIDFTPMRFTSKILNHAYIAMNYMAARISDVIWNISPRIANIFKKITKPEKNLIVEVGVPLEVYRKVREIALRKGSKRTNTIVCISHLTKEKGIDKLVEAIDIVRRQIPSVKLLIIGDGPYKPQIEALIKKMHLEENVKLLGRMSYEEALKKATECDIGVAPYLPDPRNIAYFADPTKLKEYVCCYLPVITTPVTWFAKEIVKYNLGLVIEYNAFKLADSLVRIMTSDISLFKHCVRTYSERLIQESIYLKAMRRVICLSKRFSILLA